MNWNSIHGTWQRFKGKVQEQLTIPDQDQPEPEQNGELTDMLQGDGLSPWDSEPKDI